VSMRERLPPRRAVELINAKGNWSRYRGKRPGGGIEG
jgi:hypothetical protein